MTTAPLIPIQDILSYAGLAAIAAVFVWYLIDRRRGTPQPLRSVAIRFGIAAALWGILSLPREIFRPDNTPDVLIPSVLIVLFGISVAVVGAQLQVGHTEPRSATSSVIVLIGLVAVIVSMAGIAAASIAAAVRLTITGGTWWDVAMHALTAVVFASSMIRAGVLLHRASRTGRRVADPDPVAD